MILDRVWIPPLFFEGSSDGPSFHCPGEKTGTTKLILPLFENITTLPQLHQFTRAEGTTEETSHNSQGLCTQVPPEIRANSSVMNTCHFTRTNPHRDVSCMAGILIDLHQL